MADVQPFRGIRFDADKGLDLSRLLCPPYDIISGDLQRSLHDSDPHNAIRLEFGLDSAGDSDDSNRYTRAADLLDEWLSSGVLKREERPAFYVMREEFEHHGARLQRHSIIARVGLEELTAEVIIPHERTSPAPKRDRHALLTATQANLSPIMSIYRDRTGSIAGLIYAATAGAPLAEATHADVNITLWSIHDEAEVASITAALVDAPIYLADGHHRYETALRYRDEQRRAGAGDGPHDYVMMSLLEITMPSIVVLPYHRLLRGLSEEQAEDLWRRVRDSFDVQPVDVSGGDAAAALEQRLAALAPGSFSLGVLVEGDASAYVLTLRVPPPPTSPALARCVAWIVANRLVSPVLVSEADAVDSGSLYYTHNTTEVTRCIEQGHFQVGFVLPQVPLDLFEEVVLSGGLMPIKSTYFIPKLPTGLVINRLT